MTEQYPEGDLEACQARVEKLEAIAATQNQAYAQLEGKYDQLRGAVTALLDNDSSANWDALAALLA